MRFSFERVRQIIDAFKTKENDVLFNICFRRNEIKVKKKTYDSRPSDCIGSGD